MIRPAFPFAYVALMTLATPGCGGNVTSPDDTSGSGAPAPLDPGTTGSFSGAASPEHDPRACIGEPLPPPATERLDARLRLAVYGDPDAPLEGTRVRLCALDDVDCVAPLAETLTDPDGYIVEELPLAPGGAATYLEVTGPAVAPTLLFLNAFHAEEIAGVTYGLMDPTTATALRNSSDAPDDPTRGLVAVAARSCGTMALPGVSFDSDGADASTLRRYTALATEVPAPPKETGLGVAGHLLNHPAGPSTLVIADAANGAFVGSANVLVRAGFVTTAAVAPGAR